MNKILNNGWAQALFTVLILWGLNNVMIGYAAKILEANILIYSCSSFTSSALILLLYGGKGALAKETMRSISTWGYGLILLMNYIISLNLFALVTSTEGSLIQRFSLVFSLIASWFFLARKPNKVQIFGSFMILIGIGFVCSDIASDKLPMIYALIILSAIFQAGRLFIAEFHKPHQHAAQQNDPKAKARVVGFVMFIISTMFLSILFLMALLQGLDAESSTILKGLPVYKDFFHPPSILFGLATGVILIAPIRVLEFSSINTIKTENFLAVTSLSSVSTWFWEWFTEPFTHINLKTLSETDLYAGILITLGGLIMAISKMAPKHKQSWEDYVGYAPQDPTLVTESHEIIDNTLEHFKDDLAKSAEALNLPPSALTALRSDPENLLAFKANIFPEVARLYRQKVSNSDALTGLLNRPAFMVQLKTAPHEHDVFTLLFLDLNKFKPINDTYGHEAGDKILQGIADRLQALLPKKTLCTRLGGDEFCILLLDVNKQEALDFIPKIQATIEEPFDFEDIETSIIVGASIGSASYPDDSTTPKDLLHIADKSMYREKDSR